MNTKIDAQILESLDQKIKQHSQHSAKAPPEFLEAEFRRHVNRYMIRFGSLESRFSSDRYFEEIKDSLEQDYLCYFEPKKFLENLQPSHWWQFTYAGCNAQIEWFLQKNGFEKALETIEDAIETSPTRTIPNSTLPNPIRRYMIGIGYLFPQKDSVVVHPNMLFGQLGLSTTYATADSPFLTRDLIRCPYHEAEAHGWSSHSSSKKLSDQELWDYWKDLLALSLGGLPEYNFYTPKQFRKEEPFPSEHQKFLDLGRRFVPARYVVLEPRIEAFAWCFPESS